jgi:ABC-type antimicrobial peptide transport system permease subunit
MPFYVQIVGIISDSILQGSLIISHRALLDRFPSKTGYDLLLVDVRPSEGRRWMQLSAARLADYGLEVISTPDRLATFQQVEATYISVFTALGGLGLVVGTAGLGLVVLRNLLERRGELAILRAMGFTNADLRMLIVLEHMGPLLAGTGIGLCSAILASLPVMRPASHLPIGPIAVMTLAIVLCGYICIRLAASYSTCFDIWDILRNE